MRRARTLFVRGGAVAPRLVSRLVSRLVFGRDAPRRALNNTLVHLDDGLDGGDAVFGVDWGSAASLAALEFDCWSLQGRAAHALRARHQARRRAVNRRVGSGVLVGSYLLTLSLRNPVPLILAVSSMAAITVSSLVVEAVALRRLQNRWSSHPLLACIGALGGFEQLPLVWARNIPAVVRQRDQGTYANRAIELDAHYRRWVGELAADRVEEALEIIEGLSGEFEGSLGDLRRTAAALVLH